MSSHFISNKCSIIFIKYVDKLILKGSLLSRISHNLFKFSVDTITASVKDHTSALNISAAMVALLVAFSSSVSAGSSSSSLADLPTSLSSSSSSSSSLLSNFNELFSLVESSFRFLVPVCHFAQHHGLLLLRIHR